MASDDTTRVFRRSRSSDPSDTRPTSPLFGLTSDANAVNGSDSDTKIFRPTRSTQAGVVNNSLEGFVTEPVVGWLVVIEGPGKGNFVKVGFGMNSIGRSDESRACIDFGDEQISRENHALITYDSKNRKYYLQHGGGANLTYVGSQPVLQPLELVGNEIISLGDTKLYFVAFCGERFNWE